jgi:hypothetical protein
MPGYVIEMTLICESWTHIKHANTNSLVLEPLNWSIFLAKFTKKLETPIPSVAYEWGKIVNS